MTYFDPEDQDKIKDYLIDNKEHLKELKPIKLLDKAKKKLLKKYDSSFQDEIETQFFNACKLVIAEDVTRNTGLATDGILYIIDCMGLEKFKEYIK